MSNFSPKIEESTEEQLNFIINELDARYGILASNELLRRDTEELKNTIQNFNEKSSKQTEKMLFLTYLIAFLTVVMVIGLIIQIYFNFVG